MYAAIIRLARASTDLRGSRYVVRPGERNIDYVAEELVRLPAEVGISLADNAARMRPGAHIESARVTSSCLTPSDVNVKEIIGHELVELRRVSAVSAARVASLNTSAICKNNGLWVTI